jgi:beta-xylosidase
VKTGEHLSRNNPTVKTIIAIATVFLAVANFARAQTTGTNAAAKTPREGDIVPAPGPRDRAFGISGPGAKHTAQWTNYNLNCTGSAVTNGLIPNLKPLIPDTQLRDTIVILGGDGNYYMTGSSGADIWDFNDGIELWKSADLKKWDYVGEVWSFDKDGTWGKNWLWHRKPVRAIWAPEIHYIKRLKNYFITISMPPGNRGILKSATGSPEGPYVNALANDGYFHGGIDATLFEDDDGKDYFTSGGASSISLMNDDLSATVGESHRIEFEKPADGSWTRGSVAQEGASLFKRDGIYGIYYLGGAAFYKGRYSSVVAMSTNIFGPYKNWGEAVPCGGGGNYFQDLDGFWYCTYFGNDDQSPWREKPGMVRIDFAADGRIKIADEQPAFILQKGAPTHWRTTAMKSASTP